MRTVSRAVMVRWIVVSFLVVLGPAVSAAIQGFNLRIFASNGKAAGNLPVTIFNADGTSGDVGRTGDDGSIALALDPSKNKKRYNVYKQACSRIVFAEENSDEDKRCKSDNGTELNGCRSCEPLGAFIFGDDTTVGTPSTTSSGFRFGAYATAGGKWTTIPNADAAVGTIDARFSGANPPYNQSRQIDVTDRASGAGFGGGIAFGYLPKFEGRIGFLREAPRDVPTQDVRGTRDAGGLIFEQQGTSTLSSTAFTIAPAVRLGSFTLSGGLAAVNWNVDFQQTGSLRANCPTPCQTVRTDNNATSASGTDFGWFGGIEFYPGRRWFGLTATFMRATLNDVYDPSAALGWPANWTDNNVYVGAIFRTPNLSR